MQHLLTSSGQIDRQAIMAQAWTSFRAAREQYGSADFGQQLRRIWKIARHVRATWHADRTPLRLPAAERVVVEAPLTGTAAALWAADCIDDTREALAEIARIRANA